MRNKPPPSHAPWHPDPHTTFIQLSGARSSPIKVFGIRTELLNNIKNAIFG